MFDLTRAMMLLAVIGTSTVLGVWLGYWFGVGIGKDAQSMVDAVKWAARLERARRGVGEPCECCNSTNLVGFCKDCGQIQSGKTAEMHS